MNRSLSVVVPTYRRPERLADLHAALKKELAGLGCDWEIIFVDDGSGDGTPEKIRMLAEADPCVRGIILDGNHGQQNASLAGVRAAKGSLVATLDDDMADKACWLGPMLEALEPDRDVVYGVWDAPGRQLYRRLGTLAKEALFRAILGKPGGVCLTSFRVMRRPIADHVAGDRTAAPYLSARILQKTKKIANVHIGQAQEGHASNYDARKLARLLIETGCSYTCIGALARSRMEGEQYRIKEMI